VAGGDRIRLFCGLQLPDAAVAALAEWQRDSLPGVRLVPPENLHVTLCFLGSRPVDDVPAVGSELAAAAAGAGSVRLRALRYREAASVAMIVCDDIGGGGAALAADLGARLERLGVYRPEARPWLPHVTVARFRERPRLHPKVPDLGVLGVVRAALYRSSLRPGGAAYEALETAVLGGR
jgi:RNA 2',3'-cyclic 3'-phosphodiesterase